MKKAIFLAHVKDAARQRGGSLKEYLRMTKELGYDGLECDYVDIEPDPAGFAAMLAEADLQIASVPYYCEFEKGVDPCKVRTAVEKTAAAGGKRSWLSPVFWEKSTPMPWTIW